MSSAVVRKFAKPFLIKGILIWINSNGKCMEVGVYVPYSRDDTLVFVDIVVTKINQCASVSNSKMSKWLIS